MRVWIQFLWFMIGTVTAPCEHGNENSTSNAAF
jgi:hypothetical protein